MENKNEKLKNIKDKLILAKEWVLSHSKIVLPIVLVVCVAVTLVIALNANRNDKLAKEAEAVKEQAQETENPEGSIGGVLTTPEYELEENAYPEINNLFKEYYTAQANGDIDTISKYNSYLNDIEKLRIEQLSHYIEDYPTINVYTKLGLTENSYVAYVCTQVKFKDIDKTLPGMQTYYVGTDPDGNYFINDGTYDEAIYEYIKSITVQDDVVDLNNQVVVEYNNILEENADINEFVAYLKEKINEEVGEILANAESPVEEVAPQEETPSEEAATVVSKVRAKERVNIRKSDSTQADKVGSAAEGEEFKLIEKKGNGWTEIEYNGASAFIKTEFLEDSETVAVEVPSDNNENNNNTENNDDNNAAGNSDTPKTRGKVTVRESGVRVRKEPNTDCDVVGTVYVGEKFDSYGTEGDWTKIMYDGSYAYIKTEFLANN